MIEMKHEKVKHRPSIWYGLVSPKGAARILERLSFPNFRHSSISGLIEQLRPDQLADQWDSSEIDALDLESFMRMYGDLRESLSFRSHSGEQLDLRDSLLLQIFNNRLDVLIPEKSTLIGEVAALNREVARVLALGA